MTEQPNWSLLLAGFRERTERGVNSPRREPDRTDTVAKRSEAYVLLRRLSHSVQAKHDAIKLKQQLMAFV